MNKLTTILKNPFASLNERTLLIFGLSSFLVGVLLAHAVQLQIQILRINPLKEVSLLQVTLGHLTIVVVLSLVFYFLGKLINIKTRFLDILNTVLIALVPIYLLSLENINNYLRHQTTETLERIKTGGILTEPPYLLLLTSILSLVVLGYFVYLLFTGFKTATNAKKTWHFITFFVLLLLADFLCSGLINSI